MASYPEEPCLSTPLTAINKYNKLILQIQIKERKKYGFFGPLYLRDRFTLKPWTHEKNDI